MKKKNQRDVMLLLEVFQKNVLQNKPAHEEMIAEIHLMRFKIKPLQGDVSDVNFYDKRFIETLWSLGKLDEFFQRQYPLLNKNDRTVFYTYFDSMQKKFQEDLNKLHLKQTQQVHGQQILEMEIFKERVKKGKQN
ncbi:MAG: hypothetical protein WC489_01400 [Patescibacteria group bacterium]